MSAWTSRKLILTALVCIGLMVIPIVYAKIGIGESVTLFVLGAIASATGIYNISNVLAKKYTDGNS